jgi:putative ABC transport system permease protein
MLANQRAFTLVAVIALALGIGGNTAIFTVVDGVLLRPLPYKDPDRLVHVHRHQPPIQRGPISRPDYFVWEEQNHVFRQVAAYYYDTYNLTGTDEAERVNGIRVTEDFFSLFGVSAVQGRFITRSDQESGDRRMAVIGYGLWQRRFGGDPAVVGRTITLNGEPYIVTGVAPKTFGFPEGIEIWTPAVLAQDKRQRGSNYLKVIGRLGDGVSEQQAEAQMNQISQALAQQYPDHDTNLSVRVVPLLDEQVRNVRVVLWVLLGAVAFVLLIACANVANLLLARASARQREVAIRTALGATRGRIARQLLTESVLLSLMGGALGTAIAAGGVKLLTAMAATRFPRLDQIGINGRALGFTFVVSLLTGIGFGLVPALQASKANLTVTLKEGGRGAATLSPHRHFLNRVLVVTEISLSLILLVGAGLLIESFKRLSEVNPGFDPKNVLAAAVSFPRFPTPAASPNASGRESEDQRAIGFLREVERRVASIPGVRGVGAINDLPVAGRGSVNGDFSITGRPAPKPGEYPVAEYRLVTPGYFAAIGIRQLKGRGFTDQDGLAETRPILINETLARQFFEDEDPIGQRIQVLDGNPHEIIGVVGDARQWGLSLPADPEIYFQFSPPLFTADASLVIRTAVAPGSLADAVRRAVGEVSREAPVYRVRTMMEVVAGSTAQQRFNTVLMALFAALALIMAVTGLYGVISYSVTERTHEIGVRMALGASTGDVLKLIVGQGLILTCAGVAVGLAGAFALTRLMTSLLFGVSATDAMTFGVVALLLGVVALLASLVPARRASRVDPMVALRYE